MKAETLLPLGKLDPGLAQPEAALDLSRVAADARRVEQAGYHGLLMEETKDDPFQVLALAALATERVHLGTSVAIAFARSPYVTAMSAWTLQKLSGGRFELGLGSQVRGHVVRRFGMDWHPPGPWMRDYVGAVRAIWESWQNQTPLDFASDRYNLNLTVPLFTPAPLEHPEIPVLVAAVNPYMCGVAAEVADGVRLHPVCTPRYIGEMLLPVIERKRAGRQGSFQVCLKPLIAAARDEATLAARREVARQRLAFYMSTPAYRRAFEASGLTRQCEEMAELSRHQQWQQMAERVSDDVLHQWVVVARYDDLAQTLRQRFDGIVDRVEVSIPVENAQDQAELNAIVAALNDVQQGHESSTDAKTKNSNPC
jgi:probable F420-dependent oxidoreductase